jgi:Fe/S biogenesis protein NfuA
MNLKITDKAKEKMHFYLQGKDLQEWGIRIVVRMKNDYAFSLTEISKADPSDTIIDQDGIKVLVDNISITQLDGCTVDFVESELSSGFKVEPKEVSPITEDIEIDLSDPVAKRVNDILVNEINPSIAAHGGFARLVGFRDNVVYLQMGGGCQGCGMANVTLKQGIATRIKEVIPEIIDVVDATDHTSGTDPYYRSSE